MSWLLALTLAVTPTPPPLLTALAARLTGAPAWQADFVQELVPAGFQSGTQEAGTLLLAPPARLRFDYGASGRVFAVSGNVARHLDLEAGICDAVQLGTSTWSRLPLATLLDPAATTAAFVIVESGDRLRLTPREPMPELASLEVHVDRDGHPSSVVTVDEAGNRNTFTLSGWRRLPAQPPARFEPSLPGHPPCRPEGS